MNVTIKLFATLAEHLPQGAENNSIDLDMDDNTTAGSVLDSLGVSPDEKLIILVNGIHADRDTALNHGDVLAAFPPIAGG